MEVITWVPLLVGDLKFLRKTPTRAHGDVMKRAVAHPHWCQLLEMEDDTYIELCVEFFTTFLIHQGKDVIGHRDPVIKFRLGALNHKMSFDELVQAMGIEERSGSDFEVDAI
ncbi:unnamed protein product [Linum trigynum]|uniref:Uncharacterized protein n=1 Tax=Linum trigynum TaxID=586398 RepID=A0AAV2F8F4_9ROSI